MKRFLNKEMNQNVNKLCINCKYFINHFKSDPYDPYDYSNHGKCKLFGNISLINGEIEYDYAKCVRNNKSQCSEKGIYFVSHNNKQ